MHGRVSKEARFFSCHRVGPGADCAHQTMFKYKYDNEADIPADHKSFYENRDGAWFLKVPGVVPREKLDEFRDTNHTLTESLKEVKADLKKFEGIDPDKARGLMDREQEINDQKLVKAGKIDEVVAERMATANAEHARQLQAKDTRIKELETAQEKTSAQLKQVKIKNVLITEGKSRGLQDGAETFLLAAAEKTWDLDEHGAPVAKDELGKPIYGANGDPMKPGEWLDGLQRTSPFMFKPSNGSEAGGGGGAGSRLNSPIGEINYWKAEHWNPGKQMEILGKDRPLAERMAAAAGKKLGQM